MPILASSVLTTPDFSGEKMYCHTNPSTAMDGTEKKKNRERAKLRPKNLRLSTTARGNAITVISTVVVTVYSSVKPRPASSVGSLKHCT